MCVYVFASTARAVAESYWKRRIDMHADSFGWRSTVARATDVAAISGWVIVRRAQCTQIWNEAGKLIKKIKKRISHRFYLPRGLINFARTSLQRACRLWKKFMLTCMYAPTRNPSFYMDASLSLVSKCFLIQIFWIIYEYISHCVCSNEICHIHI